MLNFKSSFKLNHKLHFLKTAATLREFDASLASKELSIKKTLIKQNNILGFKSLMIPKINRLFKAKQKPNAGKSIQLLNFDSRLHAENNRIHYFSSLLKISDIKFRTEIKIARSSAKRRPEFGSLSTYEKFWQKFFAKFYLKRFGRFGRLIKSKFIRQTRIFASAYWGSQSLTSASRNFSFEGCQLWRFISISWPGSSLKFCLDFIKSGMCIINGFSVTNPFFPVRKNNLIRFAVSPLNYLVYMFLAFKLVHDQKLTGNLTNVLQHHSLSSFAETSFSGFVSFLLLYDMDSKLLAKPMREIFTNTQILLYQRYFNKQKKFGLGRLL